MDNKKIKIFNYILYAFYILSIVVFLFKRNYSGAGLSAFSLVVTLILSKCYKKQIRGLDSSLYICANFLVLASMVLGSSYEFYDKIKYYDDFLHFYSGLICVKIGWNSLHVLDVKYHQHKLLFFIVLILFAMGVSAIHEMFEYLLDTILAMNTQVGGLKDTMQDTIDAFVGTVIMVVYYFNKIRKNSH